MSAFSDELRPAARTQSGLAFGLAGAAYALVVLGSVVRANGAGLSCPDWPLCFGQVVPSFNFGVALEWGHRTLAGGVSIGLGLLTVGVVRGGLGTAFRRSLAILWTLLAVQVVLGALTVLLGLAPWTVTAHLLCGNAFALGLVWMAVDLREGSRDAPARRGAFDVRARSLVLATAGLVAIQLFLGGLVASHFAGLACSAFPTCDGTSFVPTLSGPVGVHVIHRLNAYALTGVAIAAFYFLRSDPRLARFARGVLHLTIAQVVVGAANVLWRTPVEVTALHSALAAAIALYAALGVREVWLARAEVRPAAVGGELGVAR